jgi:hypothetical protein
MNTAGAIPLPGSVHPFINRDSFFLHILAQVYVGQDGHGQQYV